MKSTTIEEIAAKKKEGIKVFRDLKWEEGIKNLLTDLYPDNAHFIYELLQNAEDTGASIVRFTLSNKSVEFEHNGKRLFDINDIDSITSIGNSAKKDEITSIGKFGVGFKAVFAYTNTPEIHSGSYHFKIQDLFVPETEGVTKRKIKENETLFVFPFDNPEKKQEQAFEEIARGLNELGDNTLLFLSNISHIEYILPDKKLGYIKRFKHEDGHITIQAYHPDHGETTSHWLHYNKSIEIVDGKGGKQDYHVSIAFNLVKDEKKGNFKIVPLERGQVSIYFPAEKETSNLRFHIHAPFASTVARDSVRDDPDNKKLRDAIAELVVEALNNIKQRGLLSVDFLSVLPNSNDSLSRFYEPIRLAIVKAFQEEYLTPTKFRKHAPAKKLYYGPAKISDMLGDEGLRLFVDNECAEWATNAPQRNQRADVFLQDLDIEAWSWYQLDDILDFGNIISFEDCPGSYAEPENQALIKNREQLLNWLKEKSDTWMFKFYALLGEAMDIHDAYIKVDNFDFLRSFDQRGEHYVSPKVALLTTDDNALPPEKFYFIKPETYRKDITRGLEKYTLSFFEHIGLREFNHEFIIKTKLQQYCDETFLSNLTHEQHIKDLIDFLSYWKNSPNNLEIFNHSPYSYSPPNGLVIIGQDFHGALEWSYPHELCLDMPYMNTGLRQLTFIHGKKTLWSGYKDKLTIQQLDDFICLLKNLGLQCKFQVIETSVYNNPAKNELLCDYYSGKERRMLSTVIEKDYTIKSLCRYLRVQSIGSSLLIWNALVNASNVTRLARFRPNRKARLRFADSQLVYHLKTHAWIPDKKNVFYKPQDITQNMLHNDFTYNDGNGLLTAIEFGKNANIKNEEYEEQNAAAQKMGFNSIEQAEEYAVLAKDHPDAFKKFIEEIRLKPIESEFPTSNVKNKERRQDRVAEQLIDAAEKTTEKRMRSVRINKSTVNPDTMLRSSYTNQAKQMICQLCQKIMPFRKRNGEYYFEAVEIFSKKHALPKEYEAQYLALCPVCSAKYNEFIKNDEEMMAHLKEAITNTDSHNNPIALILGSEQATLRFVETHFLDLKTVLAESEQA